MARRGVPINLRPSQVGIFAVKVAVTCLCFWYLTRSVNLAALGHDVLTLRLGLAGLAIISLMAQIPLVGLRWRGIIEAIENDRDGVPAAPIIAFTAVSGFFAQVVPNIAADAIRAWMLTEIGRGWRLAAVSVIIDRVIGVAALIAAGLVILQLPSQYAALGGHRVAVTEVFGAFLIAGVVGLFLGPYLAAILELWRYTAWLGRLVKTTNVVVLHSSTSLSIACYAAAVHVLTIIAVWLLAGAAGLSLSILDAAVLFVVIVAVGLIPVSISGWGVRELTVTSLLAAYGVPSERAFLFSVSFGVALSIVALPGVVVWAFYSPSRTQVYTALSKHER